MFIIQSSFIGLLFILYSLLVVLLFKKFVDDLKLSLILVLPLLVYSIGFVMRLSGRNTIVDLGFFFTDFSVVFIYILFTASLLLGQLRYWKK